MNPPEKSRLAGLRVEAAEGQAESLVLSLQAVFRAYGREMDYDELAAVTGNAFMATCAPHAPNPSWWPAYGRDAFLERAARAYGLTLRELHPPGAAPVPPTPPEYTDHFRDSYLPFIEAAIDRDEPVLAWMGWPAPHEMLWGVITGVDAASRQCVGCSCGAPGKRVPLTGPPVQVYLVQGHAETRPTPEQALGAALGRAAAVLNNRIDAAFGVISGPAALEKWRDALTTGQGPTQWAPTQRAPATQTHLAAGLSRRAERHHPVTSRSCSRGAVSTPARLDQPHNPSDFHSRLARFLVSGRRAAIRCLERLRPHADAAQAKTIDSCTGAFREMVTCVEPACDTDRVRTQLETDPGRRELMHALARVIHLERRAAEATASIADCGLTIDD